MTAALNAEGLHTYYGKSHILHGVSLEAAEGQVTALLGRNGAGKTTTLAQRDGPDAAARRPGHDLRHARPPRWPPFRVAALGRRLCPRRPQDLSQSHRRREPEGAAGAAGPVDAESVYRLFPRLQERKSNRGRQLSGGEQEMLSIAPRAAAQSQAPDSRRAFARPGAADRARSVPHRGADARARASPCCWSSRTCA